jgi:hypothetical protein
VSYLGPEQALLLFGSMEFSILRDISMISRLLNLLDYPGALYTL